MGPISASSLPLIPNPSPASKVVTAGMMETPKPTGDQSTTVATVQHAEIDVPRQFFHSGSVSSDLSTQSAAAALDSCAQQQQQIDTPSSPGSSYRSIPPAPPSTPASGCSSLHHFDGVVEHVDAPPALDSSTPSYYYPTATAPPPTDGWEARRFLEEAITPVPQRPNATTSSSSATTPHLPAPTLPEDFSDWAVGDRYELVRILGRGSYGEVAQAIDVQATTTSPPTYVAIKRIQSPFDQQVDAVRLYRELHILRRLRDGQPPQAHDCIIRLLDVVQPPTDDLDDFHDLYLVFECKWWCLLCYVAAPVSRGVGFRLLACVSHDSHPNESF